MKPEEIFTEQDYRVLVSLVELEYQRIKSFFLKPHIFLENYEDIMDEIKSKTNFNGFLVANIDVPNTGFHGYEKKFKRFKNTILKAEFKNEQIVFKLEVVNR